MNELEILTKLNHMIVLRNHLQTLLNSARRDVKKEDFQKINAFVRQLDAEVVQESLSLMKTKIAAGEAVAEADQAQIAQRIKEEKQKVANKTKNKAVVENKMVVIEKSDHDE